MTNHTNRTLVRLAPLAAAALLATACGSSQTASSADGRLPAAPAAAQERVADGTAPTTSAPVETTAPPTTAAAPVERGEPVPDPDRTPDSGKVALPPPTPCGEFGPMPPTPDSMPTLMYDTDGDGHADDEVTAYAGGGDGWVLRIVENGIASEAQTPGIDGWAYISNDYQVDGRDYIEVTDNDEGTIFTLATVEGCVELLDTRNPIDDITIPTPTPPDPVPAGPSDLAAGPAECALVAPIPETATIVTDLTLDVTGDGVADDQIITYVDSGWIIRSTIDGVTSEVGVAGVGAGSVRALGAVDVGELSAGNEIIVTKGAGASAAVIGVYGFDTSGCIYAFSDTTGSPLSMTAGASIGSGSKFICGTGYVGASIWSLEADDTYSMYGYALVESSIGQFTYMPASDDFSEGIAVEDLPSDVFDCAGLTL